MFFLLIASCLWPICYVNGLFLVSLSYQWFKKVYLGRSEDQVRRSEQNTEIHSQRSCYTSLSATLSCCAIEVEWVYVFQVCNLILLCNRSRVSVYFRSATLSCCAIEVEWVCISDLLHFSVDSITTYYSIALYDDKIMCHWSIVQGYFLVGIKMTCDVQDKFTFCYNIVPLFHITWNISRAR